MQVIGIAGKIGAGKDEVAKRLVERWGFTIVRFADALREEVLERLPRTLQAMHDLQSVHLDDCRAGSYHYRYCLAEMLNRTKPPLIRALLQEYGTEVRRRDDPDYWTKRWARATAGRHKVVVPDMRFEDEAKVILAAGGIEARLWRIERPGHEESTHASEHGLDGWTRWDAVIRNDATLTDLQGDVDRRMEAARTCVHPDGMGTPCPAEPWAV